MSRRPLDAYYTLKPMVSALTSRVNVTGRVLDPCCGNGATSDPFPGALTNDINPDVPALWHEDATEESFWNKFSDGMGIYGPREIDWVVTNPPFNVAFPILQHAWEHARLGVAMLLRLSFLEPTNARGPWLEANSRFMAGLYIFGSPRPSFTGTGTDSVTTAWGVWVKSPSAFPRIDFVTNWK